MTYQRFALKAIVVGLAIIVLSLAFAVPATVLAQSSVRIMPLGNSITDGTAGSTDDTGYRRSLYLSLTGAGYDVDFVGSQHSGGDSSEYNWDHEGHGGWRDDQIADNVYNFLQLNPADIVLLHIGTNGLDPSPDDVEDMTQLRVADGDKIVFVDMENGAGFLYTSVDMDDNVHPNDSGYVKMADTWFAALDAFLAAPRIENLSLAATSPHNLSSDSLICSYLLAGEAITAATAWHQDGSPLMALYLPMEGDEPDALRDYSGNGIVATKNGDPT